MSIDPEAIHRQPAAEPAVDPAVLDGSHENIDPAVHGVPAVFQVQALQSEIGAATAAIQASPNRFLTRRRLLGAALAVTVISGGTGAAFATNMFSGSKTSSHETTGTGTSGFPPVPKGLAAMAVPSAEATANGSGNDASPAPPEATQDPGSPPGHPEIHYPYSIEGHSGHYNTAYPDQTAAYWNFEGPEDQYKPAPITGTTAKDAFDKMYRDFLAIEDISSSDANVRQAITDLFGKAPEDLPPELIAPLDKSMKELFLYRLKTDPSYEPNVLRNILNTSVSEDTMIIVDTAADAHASDYKVINERFTLTKKATSTPGDQQWVVTGWKVLPAGDTSLTD
jgi:hypothetical protein